MFMAKSCVYTKLLFYKKSVHHYLDRQTATFI